QHAAPPGSRITERFLRMSWFPMAVFGGAVSGALAGARVRERSSETKDALVRLVEWFGELAMFSGRVAKSAITPPYEFTEFLRQCDAIGSMSLPLVALAGAATGV